MGPVMEEGLENQKPEQGIRRDKAPEREELNTCRARGERDLPGAKSWEEVLR